jgi:GT2 family glycosyltransferase
MKPIAVVILNWNGVDLLKKYLPSVTKHSRDLADVYIIDNGSTDNSEVEVGRLFPEVQWIQLPKNVGFAGGYNEGLKNIPNPWHILLNSDVRVSENWLEPLLDFATKNPQVKALQPAILDDKAPESYEYAGAAGGYLDALYYPFCRGRILEKVEEVQDEYKDPTPIFWASGAALMVQKETFYAVGGLDADFFAHMEEIDLCWRILNQYPNSIYAVPSSTVFHLGGATLNKTNPRKVFLNFRNSLFMILKNHPHPFMPLAKRMILDGVAGMQFLLTGNFGFFGAVIKAHLAFYKGRSAMAKKRLSHFQLPQDVIYPKSILIAFFLKGKKRFQDLDWPNKN